MSNLDRAFAEHEMLEGYMDGLEDVRHDLPGRATILFVTWRGF